MMVFFECPKCDGRFASDIMNNEMDFNRYGRYDTNTIEENCCLRCPSCKTVFKVHLEPAKHDEEVSSSK